MELKKPKSVGKIQIVYFPAISVWKNNTSSKSQRNYIKKATASKPSPTNGCGQKDNQKVYCNRKAKKQGNTIFKEFYKLQQFEPELIRLFSSKTTMLSLFDHIVGLGFNGKYTQFCERMNLLINDGHNSKTREKNLLPALKPEKSWSTSKLAFMALAKGGRLKKEDQNYLDFLLKKSLEIKELAMLANEFKELFSIKKEGSIKGWITKALLSESGLKGFAKGINSDFDAVNQAVTSTISDGQV